MSNFLNQKFRFSFKGLTILIAGFYFVISILIGWALWKENVQEASQKLVPSDPSEPNIARYIFGVLVYYVVRFLILYTPMLWQSAKLSRIVKGGFYGSLVLDVWTLLAAISNLLTPVILCGAKNAFFDDCGDAVFTFIGFAILTCVVQVISMLVAAKIGLRKKKSR